MINNIYSGSAGTAKNQENDKIVYQINELKMEASAWAIINAANTR